MTPVAKRMMKMRMMATMRPMITMVLMFFHQYLRATFCVVVLKCSDCGVHRGLGTHGGRSEWEAEQPPIVSG